jgi:hypothetical protein
MAKRRKLNRRLKKTNKRLPPDASVLFSKSWDVDVHRKCHVKELDCQNAQTVADSTFDRAERLLISASTLTNESDPRSIETLDRAVLRAFESGQYVVAHFINQSVREMYRRRGDTKAEARTLTHQLSARAGVRGAAPFELRPRGRKWSQDDVQALLHVTSHLSMRGEFALARMTVCWAEELVHPGHGLDLDFALRRTQIRRSTTEARRAQDIAADTGNRYRQTTALVVAGTVFLPERGSEAHECFEAVLAQEEVSWLYRAECWFGLGYLALISGHLSNAYRYLVASQYVYGFLSLQALPHAGYRVPGTTLVATNPIDLLRSDKFAAFRPGRCEELRKKALVGGEVKEWLMSDLRDLRDPPFDPPDPLRA